MGWYWRLVMIVYLIIVYDEDCFVPLMLMLALVLEIILLVSFWSRKVLHLVLHHTIGYWSLLMLHIFKKSRILCSFYNFRSYKRSCWLVRIIYWYRWRMVRSISVLVLVRNIISIGHIFLCMVLIFKITNLLY